MNPFIVTITGPSCAGKTTLEGMLRGVGFATVVSTTTRAPRAGEIDGKNYYFVNRTRFIAMKESGEFIESVEFGGSLYGVTSAEISRISAMSKPIAIVVEPHGYEQIERFCSVVGWNCHSVFINNSDYIIANRFLARMKVEINEADDQDAVVRRFAERMSYMLSIERAWIASAFYSESDTGYDRVISSFTEENSGLVVDAIVREYSEHVSEYGGKKIAA